MKELRKVVPALLAVLVLVLYACGGGGGSDENADIDGDGIPNTVDAAPNDPDTFAVYTGLLLDYPAPASTFSAATDIGGNDLVVGYADDATATLKGVSWTVDAVAGTAGAPTVLQPLAGGNNYSAAFAADDAGNVVGESDDAGAFTAVLWPAGTTAATALPKGTMTQTAAYGISNGGRIVGEGGDGTTTVALLWADATALPVSLGNLAGGTASSAYFISEGGLVVGEADNGSETRAVLWVVDAAGAITGPFDLGKLAAGDLGSAAFGANDLGEIVGESESAAGEIHAVKWTVDVTTGAVLTAVDLGAAGAESSAYANNEANRIAGYDGRSGTLAATVWDTRNPGLTDDILAAGTAGQAYGLNEANLTVGLTGNQAFVALPQ